MSRTPSRSARLALCLVAIGLATTTADATAATVSVEDGVLVLRGTAGADTIRVGGSDDDRLVRLHADAIPTVPDGCERPWWDPPEIVDCAPLPGGVRVEAGDGDDRVIAEAGVPGSPVLTVLGGAGNDSLDARSLTGRAHLDGGPGDDTLTGTHADDVLLGGPGNDTLDGLGGADELRGGEGDDDLQGDDHQAPAPDVLDGGPGTDRITRDWYAPFGTPQPPVTVSLDGVADDGRPGEGDNVTAVETIHVAYPITLTAGADAVDFEAFNTITAPSRLTGSPRADRLRTYDGPDVIDGGAGDDWIEAGYGDDAITGGPGRDTVNADAGAGSCSFLVCRVGTGNDTLYLQDGEADSADCGPGVDTVWADPQDTLTNCETIHLTGGGTPPPAPPAPKPPVPSGTAKRCVVPRVAAGTTLAKARTRLRKARCATKVAKAASRSVKRGRVVRLSHRAGRTLSTKTTVRIVVSSGPPKRRAKARSAAAAAPDAPPLLRPKRLRCSDLPKTVKGCKGRPVRDAWTKGWWADPTRYRVVDARFSGHTTLEVPSNGHESFFGEGYVQVAARPGFDAAFRIPARRGGVAVGVFSARPVTSKALSDAKWLTEDGPVPCGVSQAAGAAYAPNAVTGVVAVRPADKTISIQWGYVTAPFRCAEDSALDVPTVPAMPSEALTTRYPASAFRNAEALRLPVRLSWSRTSGSEGTRLTHTLNGSISILRVNHKLD
jgi:Ca2+-binding RTX toxin-like protein